MACESKAENERPIWPTTGPERVVGETTWSGSRAPRHVVPPGQGLWRDDELGGEVQLLKAPQTTMLEAWALERFLDG